MAAIFPFFIILFSAVFFSELSARFRVPWVVALIVAGIIVGPSGLELLHVGSTLQFIADIGLVFLMFMAGLETRLSAFSENRPEITKVAIGSGLVPFFVGAGIALFLDFSPVAAVLIGAVFVSSSIAVVIPTFEANNLTRLKVGKTAIAATIVDDVASLILLSVVIQVTGNNSSIPLPVFYIVLTAILVSLRWAIPRVRETFTKRWRKHDMFEHELQVIFTILMGTVVLFDLLGLHPIIAGFFAGLVLSESVQSKKAKEKLHAVSYGVFIPVFFVIVGARTDLSIVRSVSETLPLVVLLVSASMASKFVGGVLGGVASGFQMNENLLLGVAGLPQLSTTLAAVFAGVELGILPQSVVVAMVVLSIITTIIAPMAVRIVAADIPRTLAKG